MYGEGGASNEYKNNNAEEEESFHLYGDVLQMTQHILGISVSILPILLVAR